MCSLAPNAPPQPSEEEMSMLMPHNSEAVKTPGELRMLLFLYAP
jgi:hypothetical protein